MLKRSFPKFNPESFFWIIVEKIVNQLSRKNPVVKLVILPVTFMMLGILNLDYEYISLSLVTNIAPPFTSGIPTFQNNRHYFIIHQVTFHSAEVLLFLNKLPIPTGELKNCTQLYRPYFWFSYRNLHSFRVFVTAVHKLNYFEGLKNIWIKKLSRVLYSGYYIYAKFVL